ncbi:hypothetical protein BD309DRAFT_878144, partial [Dichomitus squalens]
RWIHAWKWYMETGGTQDTFEAHYEFLSRAERQVCSIACVDFLYPPFLDRYSDGSLRHRQYVSSTAIESHCRMLLIRSPFER